MARKKHITWENTYTRPFVKDPVGYDTYVWSADGGMVLTFDDVESDEYNKVVDTLNGEKLITYENLHYVDGDFYDYDRFLFSIRGWGHLTSKLKLSNFEASLVQDEFAKFIKEKLT